MLSRIITIVSFLTAVSCQKKENKDRSSAPGATQQEAVTKDSDTDHSNQQQEEAKQVLNAVVLSIAEPPPAAQDESNNENSSQSSVLDDVAPTDKLSTLVDVFFKHFDLDSNNYISEEEFLLGIKKYLSKHHGEDSSRVHHISNDRYKRLQVLFQKYSNIDQNDSREGLNMLSRNEAKQFFLDHIRILKLRKRGIGYCGNERYP